MSQIQPIIDRTYLVELNLTSVSVGTNYPFQSINILAGKTFYSIQAFTASDLATSQTNKTVISDAAGANIVMTFAVDSSEEVFKFPYLQLRPGSNAGLMRLFNNKRINLEKSYATILNATGLSVGESLMFNFIFNNPERAIKQ